MVKGKAFALNPKSKDVQRKIARLERMVAQVKPEIKYADLTQNFTNVSVSSGSVAHLTAIAQGVTVASRIGNYIRVHHVEYHCYIQGSGGYLTNATDNPAYRIYLVVDTTQVGDTSPTASDLIDQPGTPVNQLRNVNQLKRFRVLYDSGPQLILVPGVANSLTTSEAKFQLHFKKENMNLEVAYNGTASSDIQKNGIYVICCTNIQAAGPADILDVTAVSRVGYTDA